MTLDMDDGYLTDEDITVALKNAGVKGGKMTFEQFCEVFEALQTVIEEGGDEDEDDEGEKEVEEEEVEEGEGDNDDDDSYEQDLKDAFDELKG